MSDELGSGAVIAPQTPDGATVAASESGDNARAEAGNVDVAKLQKRVDDLTGILSKTQSERDKAAAKAELLEKIHQERISRGEVDATEQRDYRAEMARLEKEIDESWSGKTAVSYYEKILKDADSVMDLKLKSEAETLRKEIAEMKQQLQAIHPERVKYAEKINELRSALPGFNDDQLLEVVRLQEKQRPANRTPPPGSTAGASTGASANGDGLSEEVKAHIKTLGLNLTDAEMKQIAANMAKRKGVR